MIWIISLHPLVCPSSAASLLETRLLLDQLSVNATKNIRPRLNQNEALDVYVQLWLTSLIYFDVSLGRLTLTLTAFIQWVDETKVWNETEGNGLSDVWVT